MNDITSQIRNRAADRKKTVVLPETSDNRVLQAASFLSAKGVCKVILIGDKQGLKTKASEQEVTLSNSLMYEMPESISTDDLVENLYSRRKHKGMTKAEAEEKLQSSLYFSAGLVATGKADCCVAGSVATTGEVIRAAIHSIGLREGNNILSSTFLMALKDGKNLTYADCGVVPYPDADQLADIAIESARTHKLLTQEKPIVAMLSFSTKGSAKHEKVELVTNALQKTRDKAPDLTIDGEFQFDAAFIPEVAQQKAPKSEVAGKANVFIFPNLDAGNIAYKITERLAGATATGPILQGLAKPVMDLSRGCKWQDIVNTACVAILMDD